MWTSPSTTQARLAHRHLGPWNPVRAWSPPDWPVERGRYKAECASRESHAHGAHISLPSFTAVPAKVNSANKRRCPLRSHGHAWFGVPDATPGCSRCRTRRRSGAAWRPPMPSPSTTSTYSSPSAAPRSPSSTSPPISTPGPSVGRILCPSLLLLCFEPIRSRMFSLVSC